MVLDFSRRGMKLGAVGYGDGCSSRAASGFRDAVGCEGEASSVIEKQAIELGVFAETVEPFSGALEFVVVAFHGMGPWVIRTWRASRVPPWVPRSGGC